MSRQSDSSIVHAEIQHELLSLEALLLSRCYLYELFHKSLGGEPSAQLLSILASQASVDVVDEYAYADETMAKLKTFLRMMEAKIDDERYFENIASEYARLFEGPADLPAYPWEAPYISHEATVFQKSTLAVRDEYRACNLQVKRFRRVPDDHIAIMCAFMAHRAQAALDAFREGRLNVVREQLVGQYRFVRDHMNTWLPEYAELASSSGSAHLYPQLVKGLEAFTWLDEAFAVEMLAWLEDSVEENLIGAVGSSGQKPPSFEMVEKALVQLRNLELSGLEDNELIAVA
ncbi:TorD/DmsD family molecular chaperone [Raoultibacter phocaeensis]|uniref:TorD/DmsD family molecular chaperone n=1 Tax=Raoultibacter phocaeensis TaxID=2479841 RepID=UPI00111A6DD8|nr:molecular chaperone TorD family protein [Raoultibacter phocaeensis]